MNKLEFAKVNELGLVKDNEVFKASLNGQFTGETA